jgi:hypothetical protein
MRLLPFESVDGVPFSTTPEQLRARHGRPGREGRNAVDLDELDYGRVVYRFQASGRLEEVTMQAPVLHLRAVAVPFAALAAFVRAEDPAAFGRAGFVVSPRFGIAFDPADPAWVTALAAHCLPQWRALPE